MELDRQTIEKKDFPIGRRGYDPEAVDAHLAALASQVETLRRAQRAGPGESLASVAATQVQAIVEAAESTAADIRTQADEDALRIRTEAEQDAGSTRDDAVQRAQEHVEGVSNATNLMLQRVDAMESELSALVQSLRTGADRLNADLTLLHGNMGELYDAAGQSEAVRGFSPDGEEGYLGTGVEPGFEEQTYVDHPVTGAAYGEVEGAAYAAGGDTQNGGSEAQAPSEGDSDSAGARIIAYNMALNGQSREEADQYLAENFDLPDRQALLDEVYSAVEG